MAHLTGAGFMMMRLYMGAAVYIQVINDCFQINKACIYICMCMHLLAIKSTAGFMIRDISPVDLNSECAYVA